MTAEPETPTERGADVIPLRAEDAHTETGLAEAKGAAYLDTTGTGDAKRLPIIPAHLHRSQIAKTAGEALGLHWYKARYHGLRSPVYAVKTAWYALRGIGRLTGRVLAWWHWTDGWLLESMAVAAGRAGASRRDERPPRGQENPRHPRPDPRRQRRGRPGAAAGHGPVPALVGLARCGRHRGAGAGPARRAGRPADHPRRHHPHRLPAARPRR